MSSFDQSGVDDESQLDTDQDCLDSQASSQANQTSATCYQCRKHVGVKCTTALSTILYRLMTVLLKLVISDLRSFYVLRSFTLCVVLVLVQA